MNTLVHADIFFFVTTIVVVVVGAALTVALVYLSKILRDVKRITAEVHEETILFRKDIGELRAEAKKGGLKLKSMLDFIAGFFQKHRKPRSKKGL